MKYFKILFLSIIGLSFLLGDMTVSQGKGKSRKYGADAGFTEGTKPASIPPTTTLKDESRKKEIEKVKSGVTKVKSRIPASKEKKKK